MVLFTRVPLPVPLSCLVSLGCCLSRLFQLVNRTSGCVGRRLWCRRHFNWVVLAFFFDPLPDAWPVGVDHQGLQDGEESPDKEVQSQPSGGSQGDKEGHKWTHPDGHLHLLLLFFWNPDEPQVALGSVGDKGKDRQDDAWLPQGDA